MRALQWLKDTVSPIYSNEKRLKKVVISTTVIYVGFQILKKLYFNYYDRVEDSQCTTLKTNIKRDFKIKAKAKESFGKNPNETLKNNDVIDNNNNTYTNTVTAAAASIAIQKENASNKNKNKNNNIYQNELETVDEIFAVGRNSGEFGFYGDTRILTKLPDHIQQLDTKHIYNGHSYSIFASQNHAKMYYLPNNNTAFEKFKHVNIRQIFCNVNGECTFWQTQNGAVYAFGNNSMAALGLGHSQLLRGTDPVHIPFFDDAVSNVIDIQSAAANYSFALCSKHNAKSHIIVELWARLRELYCPAEIVNIILNFYNSHYELYSVGFSLMGSSAYWTPIKALNSVNICQIATGFDHSVFLQTNGIVWCVGDNRFSQLGLGHLNMVTLPTKLSYFVDNEIEIKDIKCGQNHCLALDVKGNVYSWGHNGAGQCGDGSTYHIKKPKLISVFDAMAMEIVEIGCGGYHSFCKSVDGGYYLFGGNKYNECVTYDETQYIVLLPQCINEIVQHECGKIIKSVYLGQSNTKLIISVSKNRSIYNSLLNKSAHDLK